MYGLQDFTGRGVSPHFLLGKNRLSVYRHFEDAAARLDQPDIRVGICLLQLSRQTGGSRVIVSNYAILDGYTHLDTNRE